MGDSLNDVEKKKIQEKKTAKEKKKSIVTLTMMKKN